MHLCGHNVQKCKMHQLLYGLINGMGVGMAMGVELVFSSWAVVQKVLEKEPMFTLVPVNSSPSSSKQ